MKNVLGGSWLAGDDMCMCVFANFYDANTPNIIDLTVQT